MIKFLLISYGFQMDSLIVFDLHNLFLKSNFSHVFQDSIKSQLFIRVYISWPTFKYIYTSDLPLEHVFCCSMNSDVDSNWPENYTPTKNE